jgi:nitronate monooxygenase
MSMKDLKRLLDIRYPIVQAPMLGVTTPAMAAAVSNAGGLGSLPIGGLPAEKSSALIRETKARTDKPFAVNLFAHKLESNVSDKEIEMMEQYLEKLHQQYNLPFQRKPIADYKFYNHLDQIDVLLDERVPIVSFTFGMLEAEVVSKLKKSGVTLIGTATSVKEAALLDKSGMDVIVAQGIEAGGHRGSFLEDEPLPQVGLISLLPQIVDHVSVPVIAAGGLFDYRTIGAAFALGAAGAQLGSYFIAADESAASEVYKAYVLSSTDTSTELTRAFTGKWARGIRNNFMQQMQNSGLSIPYYTLQNSLTSALRDYGKSAGIAHIISLWAGQSASQSKRGSTEALFRLLIEQLQSQPHSIF